jgi:hypothetical protein
VVLQSHKTPVCARLQEKAWVVHFSQPLVYA